MIAALVLVVALPSRTVAVTAGAAAPVVIKCPVGATTRIVFPEPVMASLSPGMQQKLGIGWEPGSRSRVALVRPVEHPSRAVLQFTGKQSGRFIVRLETVASGASSEVSLTVASKPSADPQPVQRAAVRPSPRSLSSPPPATAGDWRGSKPSAEPAQGAQMQRRVQGTISSPRDLSVEVASGFVRIKNRSAFAIPAPRLALVASDGRRFLPKDGSLSPAWETRLSYAQFAPPIPETVEIVRAELLGTEALQTTVESDPAPPAVSPAAASTQTADVVSQMPVPESAAPSPAKAAVETGEGLLDRGILSARVRPVGRVESLPGQREVELADILEAENFLWLRFNVRGGARAHVGEVSWEHGPIASYTTEVVNKGKDLLVVVQLPRALTTKRTRVTLRLDDGVRKFSLSAPWLSSLLKDIVGF